VNVEVELERGHILFYATVGDLGEEPGPHALLHLLHLNALAAGTNGGTLGVLPESGEVVLTFAWVLERLDYTEFEGLLETAYSTAVAVRALLRGDDGAPAAVGGGGEPGVGLEGGPAATGPAAGDDPRIWIHE
jgi:hypothetical protein